MSDSIESIGAGIEPEDEEAKKAASERAIVESFVDSLRRQSEDDAMRWLSSQRSGESPRAKCLREAREFCEARDRWIESTVGPIHQKRRKRKKDPSVDFVGAM